MDPEKYMPDRRSAYSLIKDPSRLRDQLATRFERAATFGEDYSSYAVVGGLGFGDFDSTLSDIDTWVVMPDALPTDCLPKVQDLNSKIEDENAAMISDGIVGAHNFRHPPTFLTESEALTYRKAFAAKIGLPLALGIFPTVSGISMEGDYCFTEEQLARDLAFTCGVFRDNVVNLPPSNTEDVSRYCFKRATYFLRFQLFQEKGIYIRAKDGLLDAAEQELPEWKEVMPMLRTIQATDNSENVSTPLLRRSIDEAMSPSMRRLQLAGLIDETQVTKGNVRTRLHWTSEKLRWDYLLLQRNPETLSATIHTGTEQGWGFSFSKVNQLFEQFFDIVTQTELHSDWERFKESHLTFMGCNDTSQLASYYDEVYLPTLTSFFRDTSKHVDQLF